MLPRWITSLRGGPQRVNHSAVLVGHRIFSFGGYCMGEDYENQYLIDVHVFNTFNNRWTKIPLEMTYDDDLSQVPYMRYGHASVALGEVAYLWGGRNDVDGTCNKLFSFDTETLKWHHHATKGNRPRGRDGHAMCVINGNIYVFGGYEEHADQFSDEMFVLELPDMLWDSVRYKNDEVPTWRDFHTITAIGKLIYVFGGRSDRMGPFHSNSEIYDDKLKVFDTESLMWSTCACRNSVAPTGRRSHSSFVYENCLYIFGGYNSNLEQHYNDVWKFDPVSQLWSKVITAGTPPMTRRRQCCCLFENRLYIFGGTSPLPGLEWEYRYDASNDERNLHDHDDIHVLDFCPSLKTLCLDFAHRYGLDISPLPNNIRWESYMLTTPNSISKSPSHHG